MTTVTYSDGIAIFKVVFYSPALIAGLIVCWRHGFAKASGWYFLAVFSILRLVGASAQLVTITNPSSGAITTAEIASLIGLSPLLLASLGLLARVYYSILKAFWGTFFQLGLLRIIQVPTIIALILSIVGFTSAPTIADASSQGTVQASIIIYLVVLVALTILTAGAAIGRRTTHRGEAILIGAVAASLPFLFVRVSYAMVEMFGHDPRFNPLTGSETIELVMVTLEEMVVVLVYLWAGLSVKEAIPAGEQSQNATQNVMYRAGRGDFGGGRLGLVSLAVHAFQEAKTARTGDEGARTENHDPQNTFSY